MASLSASPCCFAWIRRSGVKVAFACRARVWLKMPNAPKRSKFGAHAWTFDISPPWRCLRVRRHRQFSDFGGSKLFTECGFCQKFRLRSDVFTLGKIARQNFDRFGALGIFS